MLGALLLAIVGIPLLLLARTWAREAADTRLVRRLIDLAVQDQNAAGLLLREHPELLTARYLHDETPLHFCAVEGFVDGVRFLAKAGVPIDAENAYGDTALVDAVTMGNLPVLKVLLSHGANANAASRTYGPALHVAVARGDVEAAAALLRAGARADYVTEGGQRIGDALPKAEPQRTGILKLLDGQGVKP